MTPFFEYLQHVAVAAVVFIAIGGVAVVLHFSAHLARPRLPSFFNKTIDAVAVLLFLLDVIGFVLLVMEEFWKSIPPGFRTLLLRSIGLNSAN